jgi:predicted transcriptional regulator of viral defense system
MIVNGVIREFLIAEKEKAMLDFLYINDFYKDEPDISAIRFNEIVLEREIDWDKLDKYLERFNNNALEKRIRLIQKINNL